MAKRKKAKATKKATKAAKAKKATVAKVARDLGISEDQVREAVRLAARIDKAAAGGGAVPDLLPARVGSDVGALDIDFGKPLEPQAERLAALVTRKLPTEFALLPEADYVTNPNARREELQPGFVVLPAPIIDRFDDGSGMEWHGAAIIDGQLVFQGRRRERAATSRVLGMAKGRSFTTMLQDEQNRVGERPTPVPADHARCPNLHPACGDGPCKLQPHGACDHPDCVPPTGGTSLATLEQAGLAKAGSPLEGRFFRLPTTTDGGGVARVRELAEFVILASLGLHTSTRLSNFLEKSSVDFDDRTGKAVERADRKTEGLYPGGGGGGLY